MENINNLKNTNINDNKSCYLNINSRAGGIESQYWTNILLKMYIKWLEIKNLRYKILFESKGVFKKKPKSVSLLIEGEYAYKWFKTESGIHRLVRKNPFNFNKRHTSFSSVYVYPKIDEKININLNKKNTKINFCKSSGPGGQHINKTYSSVKITHIPTGLFTKCQKSRYQNINKNKAIKQLKNKISDLESFNIKKNKKILEKNKLNINSGKYIRSYILDNSIIIDNRTGIEIRDIKSILNGNLHIFVENSLKLKL